MSHVALHRDPPFPLPARTVHLLRVVLSGSALGISIALGGVYAITVGRLEVWQLLAMGFALEGTIVLSEVPTGAVADTYSRRLSIIIGLFGIGVGVALPVLWTSFPGFLLGQVVWGLSYTFLSGAGEAWLVDEAGNDAADEIFAVEERRWLLASVVGTLVGGLVGVFSLAAALVLGAVLYLLAGVVMALTMTERGFRPTPRQQLGPLRSLLRTIHEGVTVARASRVVLILLIVNVLTGLAGEGIDRLWVKHVLDTWPLPTLSGFHTWVPDPNPEAIWFSLFALAGALISLAATHAWARVVPVAWSARHAPTVLAALAFIETMSVVCLALAPTLWMVLAAVWVRRCTSHLAYPIQKSWINRHLSSERRATVLSLVSQGNAAGELGGGLSMMGATGLGLSVRGVFWCCAAFIAPSVGLYLAGRAGTPATDAPAS